jgi:hypothetical protein
LNNNFFTPKQSIGGLQLALNLNAPYTQEWLGCNSKRWKYVYFTEPDLIRSSRPGSTLHVPLATIQRLQYFEKR